MARAPGRLVEGGLGTPLGPFFYALSERGLARCGFAPPPARSGRDAAARALEAQVRAYFAGELRAFDVPLDESGLTAFQREVYALTRAIPHGETRAYGDLAVALASGARAVGRAMAAVPTPLVVPAHRVVRMDGSLGGFQGREAMKAWLIDFEARVGGTRR